MPIESRRAFLATLGASTLAGCAGVAGKPAPPVEAPTYRVGDRWVYRARDGFRTAVVWEETHVITSAGSQGIQVQVTQRGPTVNNERVEQWAAPGIVARGAVFDEETKTFQPPLMRYRFPLLGGDRWSQRVRDPDQPPGPYGGISRTVIVGGHEEMTTPAGKFDTVRMRVFMRLDDETFWRYPTECNYLLWYAPAVAATVREEKEASYLERGGGAGSGGQARIRSQNATLELVASHRAR